MSREDFANAIAERMGTWRDDDEEWLDGLLRAFLAEVSPQEIEAAANALVDHAMGKTEADYLKEDDFDHMARMALAASRSVLLGSPHTTKEQT